MARRQHEGFCTDSAAACLSGHSCSSRHRHPASDLGGQYPDRGRHRPARQVSRQLHRTAAHHGPVRGLGRPVLCHAAESLCAAALHPGRPRPLGSGWCLLCELLQYLPCPRRRMRRGDGHRLHADHRHTAPAGRRHSPDCRHRRPGHSPAGLSLCPYALPDRLPDPCGCLGLHQDMRPHVPAGRGLCRPRQDGPAPAPPEAAPPHPSPGLAPRSGDGLQWSPGTIPFLSPQTQGAFQQAGREQRTMPSCHGAMEHHALLAAGAVSSPARQPSPAVLRPARP